jgi:hypothetical protein
MCRLSWNLGASTSWNPQGLSRPVMGLLYLYLYVMIKSSLHRLYIQQLFMSNAKATDRGPSRVATSFLLNWPTHDWTIGATEAVVHIRWRCTAWMEVLCKSDVRVLHQTHSRCFCANKQCCTAFDTAYGDVGVTLCRTISWLSAVFEGNLGPLRQEGDRHKCKDYNSSLIFLLHASPSIYTKRQKNLWPTTEMRTSMPMQLPITNRIHS